MKVIIVGAGAAGFFAAIHVRLNHPQSQVIILEKSSKVLSKVKVSGGGRCNVCNVCDDIDELSKNYPRGSKQLRKMFGFFRSSHTMQWFEKRGVELVVQEDDCVFPKSQNSQTIIDCFLTEAQKLNVEIILNTDVVSILKKESFFQIETKEGKSFAADKVIVTTGGQPKEEKLNWLKNLGHKIEKPVPSLFTFNMPSEKIVNLMGIVVENATAKIEGTKLSASGPLLITHWGMSGPAILKLSAFGARILNEKNYSFHVLVHWLGDGNDEEIKLRLQNLFAENKNKKVVNVRFYEIPLRLWEYLLNKAEISFDKTCDQLSSKTINKLVALLTCDRYSVSGKTTFKEEFVTCGGVSLEDVSIKSLQSKKVNGLYFAGEILDIDGITGGFNFQAAWTTAFIAAKLNDE